MAISLTEILILIILPIVAVVLFIILPIVAVVLFIRWFRSKKRVTESVVLSLIRSKNGATIDDLIIGAHISAGEAEAILRRLLAKGILRVEERNGKTIYKIA